jgi:hypothetical protein
VLQDTIAPLQPALVYLTHNDTKQALAENFTRRGSGFKDFVIKFAITTPYAQQRGLIGHEGMVEFWVDFAALTDQLYDRFRFRKIAPLNATGEWETLERRVLDFLSLEYVIEQQLPEDIAAAFTGTYFDQREDRTFTVRYRNHDLVANLFLDDWTRLIPKADSSFLAAGWHFVVNFDKDPTGKASALRIAGQDVDYLSLVGTVAERVSD